MIVLELDARLHNYTSTLSSKLCMLWQKKKKQPTNFNLDILYNYLMISKVNPSMIGDFKKRVMKFVGHREDDIRMEILE